MDAKHSVTWFGAGRKAMCKPNPAYPEGIDLDASRPDAPSCKIMIPYPAVEVGQWLVECKVCGFTSVVTAAGRPDDPRSVTVPCKTAGTA